MCSTSGNFCGAGMLKMNLSVLDVKACSLERFSGVQDTLSSVLPSIFLGHINLSDSVFPTYNQWMENAQDQFHRWRRRWRLPERFEMTWTYQAEHMWKMHARKSTVVSMRSHCRDLKALKGYILCPADHHPHQAHLSCPVHYHWLLDRMAYCF